MSTPREPRARASSIDHPRYAEMLDLLRLGGYFEPSAWACGIAPKAVRSALLLDDAETARFEQARAEGVQARLAQMELSDDWKREAWLLERLAPKAFHLPTKVTGVPVEEGGAPISVLPATRAETLAELRQVQAEIAHELAKETK